MDSSPAHDAAEADPPAHDGDGTSRLGAPNSSTPATNPSPAVARAHAVGPTHAADRIGVRSDMDTVYPAEQMAQIAAAVTELLRPALDSIGATLRTLTPITTPVLTQVQRTVAAASAAATAALRSTTDFLESPEFRQLLATTRERYFPPNWSLSMDITAISHILASDGLPLVWVPRADLVTALTRAPDRAHRIQILLDHHDEVLEDCEQLLATVTSPVRPGDATLAREAVRVLRDGHPEAAQALAAAVLESALLNEIDKTDKVQQRIAKQADDRIFVVDMRLRLAMAPLKSYFRSFTPGQTPDDLRPPGPNRHLTVHQASPEHLTPANALVSVMLLCSTLRALQDIDALTAYGVDTSWLTGRRR